MNESAEQQMAEDEITYLKTRIASLEAQLAEREKECFSLAADQCHDGYAGEHGDHCCREQDGLRAEVARLTAQVEKTRIARSINDRDLRKLIGDLEHEASVSCRYTTNDESDDIRWQAAQVLRELLPVPSDKEASTMTDWTQPLGPPPADKRKYSVAEIERMRWSVKELNFRQVPAPNYEEILRTYMFNGTDPEELEAACRGLYR